MKKQEKLLTLSARHKEALANLAGSADFNALTELFEIEERNIILWSFKVNSSDPELKAKKAWAEGRIFELQAILNSFKEAKKKGAEK